MTTTSPSELHRSAMSGAYLDHLAGEAAAGLPTAAALESAQLGLTYRDRFLNGPAFLGETERRAVVQDLRALYGMLRSLPERVFGGSLTALAQAVGMDPRQTALITRSARSGVLRPLGRADLYHDGTAFKLLELNVTSALGGADNADINRAMLRYPPLDAFVRGHQLRYRDTLDCVVRTMYAECAAVIPADRPPVVAVVDTVENFAVVGPILRMLAGKLADYDVDGIACDLGQLTYPDGRPTVDGRAIDVVFRYFLVEDLSDAVAEAHLEPLLTAVEQNKVGLFSRLDAELYGNKGTLAVLSDDRHRDLFDAAELSCIDRLLPWTRYVRAHTTDLGGSRVDLLAYALAHQTELVLKPTLLHGGSGVVPGWTVNAAEWENRLISAMEGPFVVQHRVRPAADPFPDGAGGSRDLFLNWGIYLGDHDVIGDDGYAGGLVRGSADPAAGVVSLATGAEFGCVFHDGGPPPIPASWPPTPRL
ncbi:hypothetical protein [Couchioplanes caeruleus]|uniref:Circularly permuted ATP-grasp superfamily protein n=2 Tax=Couchioplanes caeruleus TaxID=56438 RepID=A0A1K0GZV4_9ACTN|nr:hypothetical protein [Couchioplanes caeruleus]OJF14955.1 hypothetical protein BG844_07100 [Couchioplanes caeruleus subsp. caeruleus]ROP30438.1 hypothetical protein EDD30_3288 [Couchioplanes caeruleus]